MTTINVGRDFSRYPAGRFEKDGPHSGEAFRERFLRPALAQGQDVEVELDDALGYGSSFLEEAFGGLVRGAQKISRDVVLRALRLVTTDRALKEEVLSYIKRG
jgi:hypothetical protein